MKTVQDLLDHQEIVELHIRYATALDTRDWDLMRTVFAEDGHADFWVGGIHDGIESILHGCASIMENLDATQHAISNHHIELSGDTATAQCYVVAGHIVTAAGGGPTCTVRGKYEDELVRTQDGWRLARRILTVFWSEGNTGIFASGSYALTGGTAA